MVRIGAIHCVWGVLEGREGKERKGKDRNLVFELSFCSVLHANHIASSKDEQTRHPCVKLLMVTHLYLLQPHAPLHSIDKP